jgi:hypothetical protein
MRRKWDWRPLLTAGELKVVREHEAALRKVEAARREADKTRLEYMRVANRALQRAKYQGKAL